MLGGDCTILVAIIYADEIPGAAVFWNLCLTESLSEAASPLSPHRQAKVNSANEHVLPAGSHVSKLFEDDLVLLPALDRGALMSQIHLVAAGARDLMSHDASARCSPSIHQTMLSPPMPVSTSARPGRTKRFWFPACSVYSERIAQASAAVAFEHRGELQGNINRLVCVKLGCARASALRWGAHEANVFRRAQNSRADRGTHLAMRCTL
jgi:hypothetical protein